MELLRLLPALEGHKATFVTVHGSYRNDVGNARFYVVRDVTRWNKLRWLETLAKLAWILWREKPEVVLSTGALPGYFALRLGKYFGARTIWIDSLANVESLSMSGERVRKYADLWLTQWPHLAKPEGPVFRGSVL